MSSSTEESSARVPGWTTPPFAGWRPGQRLGAAAAALFATLILGAKLQVLDQALRTEAAPLGIVSFELARTTDAAQAILASWQAPPVMADAWASVMLDYAWLVLYALTLTLGCSMVALDWVGRSARLTAAISVVAWLQPLAALLDAIENTAMVWMLHTGEAGQPWPMIAFSAAVPKFAIVCIGIAVILGGAVDASWRWLGVRLSN